MSALKMLAARNSWRVSSEKDKVLAVLYLKREFVVLFYGSYST